MRRIVSETYETAKKILADNRDKLDAIADRLIEVETLDAAEFAAFFEDEHDEEDPVTPQKPPSMPQASERPTVVERDRPSPTLDSPPSPAPA